ncbi:MAG: hypothetical protein PHS53_01590 [Candidatus Pacebacteria bacterium]|nr:hypothetical protein [Candidatus Paceibacterota bacterium]MDD5356822.1 hypothetical protein [Candidatus Paceibacterota bacterium]
MLRKFFTLAKEVREIKPRITPGAAALLIFFALIIDLVQFLVNFLDEILFIGVILNWLIDIAVIFGFWLWFRFKRVKFVKISAEGKSSATGLIAFIITVIIKLIPVLNALPAWTANVMINIGVSWVEDLAAQDRSGTLAKMLPGGKKALSQGAKKQALEARRDDRRNGREGYTREGMGSGSREEEKEQQAMLPTNTLDLSNQSGISSGGQERRPEIPRDEPAKRVTEEPQRRGDASSEADRIWQERDRTGAIAQADDIWKRRDERTAQEEKMLQEKMGGMGNRLDKIWEERDRKNGV